MKKTGTREWATTTVNIQQGCENNCRYCYARSNAVRFKRCTAEQWPEPVISSAKVNKRYGNRKSIVMFPSAHDLTPLNIEQCVIVIEKLLAADNHLLIVSKPHLSCITQICDTFREYKEQIVFRFTIGSMCDDALKFWEPNATTFNERLMCLQLAFTLRYKTSVSCEPYLDNSTVRLYEALAPFITDTFWIGKLREFARRVDLSGVTDGQRKEFVEPLLVAQTDESVRLLYERLNNKPHIKWKDSVREVIEKEGEVEK